jgi:hypothetical protein
MKNLVVITIVGTVNKGVTTNDVEKFAVDAVSTWGGQRHPDDPLFDSINVTCSNAQRIGTVEEEDE